MDAGQRVHRLYQIDKVLTGKQNFLLNNLHQLDTGCKVFERFYAEYDVNRVTPANGFRSYCKIIGIMIQNISEICQQSKPFTKSNVHLLAEYTALSNLFLKQLELGKMIRSKGMEYSLSKSSDLDRKIIAKAHFTEAEIAPFFGKVGFFFIAKDFQEEWRSIVYTTHFMGLTSAFQKFRYLTSKSYATRMQIKNSVQPDLRFIRRAIDISQFPVSWLYKWKLRKDQMTYTWIDVPVEGNRHVVLLPDSKSPACMAENYRSVRRVRCLLIKPKDIRVGAHLVLHSHGGAFLGGSTKSEAPVCADRVAALGVTFLLPEYAVAPEHPYPAAVQDVLDVYMFLVSGTPRVLELIGFQPKKILMSGASAGGTISLAVTFALNAIRKRGQTASMINLMMPCGLNLQFPGALLAFIPVPSNIVYDFMCTPPIMLMALSFYHEADPKVTDEQWYLKPNEKHVMKRLSDRSLDPIYNPLAFTDWEDLRDIPLSVIVGEMDILLDQSVLLIKKWAGHKDFDLAIGMPHGFINNPDIAVKNDNRTVMNRMAQAFKIKI